MKTLHSRNFCLRVIFYNFHTAWTAFYSYTFVTKISWKQCLLLKKSIKSWFHEIFFQWEWILIFPQYVTFFYLPMAPWTVPYKILPECWVEESPRFSITRDPWRKTLIISPKKEKKSWIHVNITEKLKSRFHANISWNNGFTEKILKSRFHWKILWNHVFTEKSWNRVFTEINRETYRREFDQLLSFVDDLHLYLRH